MARPRKPARLWQRPDTGEWIIRDGAAYIRTGASGDGSLGAAEDKLREHIAGRSPKRTGPAQPSEITVGEVLALYARDRGPQVAGRETLAYCIKALAGFWGSRTCDAVKGSTCRSYATQAKNAPATIRRRLGVLQAALNYAHAEGVLIYAPKVTLADAGDPRDRWLTRDEAARLLHAASPHLRRAILISLATGTRISAVLALRWTPSVTSGWADVEAGIIHRRGRAEAETKKRRGSVRMTRGLQAHMRRWARGGGSHVVMWRGKQVGGVKTAFAAACERAGLDDVTIHDLKRTAVTWAFQRGMSREDAADWFDTSAKTLERVYRQFSPEHQKRALAIMEGK